ncbi:hypothetical protein F5B21DRAFT_140220 [Xylaria acuta]|nr:hypothetical protein F5B21DRAFT_140220 [Xylaria acuta]
MDSLLDGIEDEGHFQPDELVSLLQQCDEALCITCQTELSTSDTDDYFEEQQNPVLKCRECAQSIFDTKNTDKPPEHFDKTQSLVSGDVMQDIRFEHDHASASTGNAFHRIAYPSKILYLVDDIKTHCRQDKR